MNKFGWFLFISINVVPALLLSQPLTPHFSLRQLWEHHDQIITVFDVEKDGQDEFLYIHSDIQIDVTDWSLFDFEYSFNFPMGDSIGISPIPMPTDNSFFALAKTQSRDKIQYEILKRTGGITTAKKLVDYKRLPSTPPEHFMLSMQYLAKFRNAAGEQLSLFSYNTSYDHNAKRGVCAVDVENAIIRWSFLCGPQLNSIRAIDIDRDGADEILLGTYAPANGLAFNGTRDDSAYVFVLNDDGNLLWQQAIGPYFTGAYLMELELYDNHKKLVIIQHGINEEITTQDRLLIVDPTTWDISTVRHYGLRNLGPRRYCVQKLTGDLNGDGQDEIIIGNEDGYIRMLDKELNQIDISQNFQQPIHVELIEDLNGDGTQEVVGYIDYDRIVVLNTEMDILCDYPITGEQFIDADPFRRDIEQLLKIRSGKGGRIHRLLKFEQSLLPTKSAVLALLEKSWIFILLLSGSLLLIFYRTRRERLSDSLLQILQILELDKESLIVDKRLNIKQAGKKWSEIANQQSAGLLNRNLGEIQNDSRLFEIVQDMILARQPEKVFSIQREGNPTPVKLHSTHVSSLGLFVVLVVDISIQDHLQQVQQWARLAQKLAHGIKNPLTSVKLNAEELEEYLREQHLLDQTEVAEYIRSITKQVDKLKRMSDGFMRFVEFDKPLLQPTDINHLLRRLVGQFPLPETASVKIDWELHSDLPDALIDQEQFKFAFHNVFYNAVESLNKSGRIQISTNLVQLLDRLTEHQTEFVEIRIQDTGEGIPAEYFDKIIQPYFSTKADGTGLGLSIVDKIVKSHNGDMDISSKVGEGTTVTLRFRAATQQDQEEQQ